MCITCMGNNLYILNTQFYPNWCYLTMVVSKHIHKTKIEPLRTSNKRPNMWCNSKCLICKNIKWYDEMFYMYEYGRKQNILISRLCLKQITKTCLDAIVMS